MANDNRQTPIFDLRALWRALVQHWRSIVTCASVGLILASVWSFISPREYTANATAMVFAGASSSVSEGQQANLFTQAKASLYQTLAQNPVVVTRAYELARLKPQGSITVAVPLDTNLIRIKVVRRDPREAANLANAFIDSLAEAVTKTENGTVDGSAPTGLPSVVKIQTFTPAMASTIPSAPRVKLGLALGLLLGTLAGLAVAGVRSVLDRRIRSEKGVEEEFGVSVVGLVPVHSRQEGNRRLAGVESRVVGGDGFRTVEAFKELRTNLQFMNPDRPPRVIAVTSPLPEEGKSTVALNLAVTIASRGQAVILVDGDLRRPTVAKSFGLVSGVGLTDVVVGNASLDEVINEIPETPNLRVLACGPIPPNPSEILSSERFGQILRELSNDAMVIVDAPPLIPVTDASIIAARFDGALVVVQAGRTTRDQLGKALSNLAKVNARVLGCVINRVPSGLTSSYSYGGYYYGKSYYAYYESESSSDGGGDRTKRRSRRRSRRRDGSTRVVGAGSSLPPESEGDAPVVRGREGVSS
ncbi:MAG: polysaccharide biosynthesis tyrosine autokinase [Tetrasphaera sp.]|nr:polysaccharide biosynthesis tyrosine autokinase [Tetrasphaera sp.]